MGEKKERSAIGGDTRAGDDTREAAVAQDGNRAAEARTTDDHESNHATGAGMSGVVSPSRAATPAPAPHEDAESPTRRVADTPDRRTVGLPPAESWRRKRKA